MREALNVTQEDAGKVVGLSAVGYGHYEREHQAFSVEQVFRLAEFLHQSPSYFFGVNDSLTPEEDEAVSLLRGMDEGSREMALESLRVLARWRRSRQEGTQEHP